jgi:hypothetical protein
MPEFVRAASLDFRIRAGLRKEQNPDIKERKFL